MTINLLLKFLLAGLGLGLIAYFILCLALLGGQNRLIFLPQAHLESTPAYLELDYEEVWIPVMTWGGKLSRLHGWWIPGEAQEKRVLLYLHGNGGNISYNLGAVEQYHQLGFSVLLFDYRGYGRSKGNFPSESEVYRDAQAAWNYLVQAKGIQPHHIFIYGHSLGGAIAIDLAVRQPQAAAVIADNTFTSMRDMIGHQSYYRFFPTDLLLTQRFDSLGKLPLLRVPLLLIHGTDDRTVPASMSQVLFENATVPKKLALIPNAAHNDLISVGGEAYTQAVEEFLDLIRITPPKVHRTGHR